MVIRPVLPSIRPPVQANTGKLEARLLAFLMLISLVSLIFGAPEKVNAQAGTPYEVLAEINGLRIANGMTPLNENQYLNIAAQNHADWIVATGQGGHTGVDGSTPADRALAVGYGEGAAVSVTENWARGPGLTANSCVYDMWAPSSAHINNMLTTWHNEFGAGVALDGQGMTVYVVKFGHVVGSVPPPQTTSVPSGPTGTPAPLVQPIATAQANSDGSVIHVVQFGQTLWAIAEAYEINMITLLEQNYLTEESAIFPEQELLIVPANVEAEEAEEDTEELTPTPTEEPTPTPTRTPTRTTEVEQAVVVSPTPTEAPNPAGNFLVNIFSGDTLWVGIGLVAVSLFGIGMLLFTSSRLK